jgi:hypothetical protein
MYNEPVSHFRTLFLKDSVGRRHGGLQSLAAAESAKDANVHFGNPNLRGDFWPLFDKFFHI